MLKLSVFIKYLGIKNKEYKNKVFFKSIVRNNFLGVLLKCIFLGIFVML